jgi:hypothetical protein
MVEFFTNPIVASSITAVLTWLLALGKNKRDLKSMSIDNEVKASKYYQGMLDDMAVRLDRAISELIALEERHRNLMEVNRKILDELQKYKQLNGKVE